MNRGRVRYSKQPSGSQHRGVLKHRRTSTVDHVDDVVRCRVATRVRFESVHVISEFAVSVQTYILLGTCRPSIGHRHAVGGACVGQF